jgi:hypothetical protein
MEQVPLIGELLCPTYSCAPADRFLCKASQIIHDFISLVEPGDGTGSSDRYATVLLLTDSFVRQANYLMILLL